ncbi:MAG: DUF4160 domain-containing protein [Bacteroidia bacterium]
MPKIATYKYLVFYLVSYDLSERLHLHIFNKKGSYANSAKIWLDTLEVFEKGNLTSKEINVASKLIEKNKMEIINSIERFRSGEKVKTIELK